VVKKENKDMENTQPRRILAIDIGGGTQDIVIYEEGKSPENFIQLVLPSPTSIVADRIKKITAAQKGLHLSGTIMGGGRCVRAIKKHLKAGFPVTAEEEAAKTVKDDLERVKNLGIVIKDSPPEDYQVVETKDVDLETLRKVLELYHTDLPQEVAIAVQDHGEAPPGMSNRNFRFEHWKSFIQGGGMIYNLAYLTPPDYLTRMKAVKKTVPQALVMDTCSAAILGSFEDELVQSKLEESVVLVNIGNQHTFAALVNGERIYGIFEHHTRLLDSQKLFALIKKLRRKELTHEEIFADGGHGCYIAQDSPESDFNFVGVTGPRRSLAQGLGFHMVNPHGNMMVAGCFGLIEAAKNRS
jgi:uncharacterized protein (DUF1786 family)